MENGTSVGSGIALAGHAVRGRGPGKGFPGALQNTIFVDPTPSRTLFLSIQRLLVLDKIAQRRQLTFGPVKIPGCSVSIGTPLNTHCPILNHVLIRPAGHTVGTRGPGKNFPVALQNTILVDPTPPGALWSTISVDPTPPGALQNNFF